MSVTLTQGALKAAQGALLEVGPLKLPPKHAAWLARVKVAAGAALEQHEAARMDLLDRYAQRDAAGERVVVDGRVELADAAGFAAAYADLCATPCTLDVEPWDVTTLPDDVRLPADALVLLGPLCAGL